MKGASPRPPLRLVDTCRARELGAIGVARLRRATLHEYAAERPSLAIEVMGHDAAPAHDDGPQLEVVANASDVAGLLAPQACVAVDEPRPLQADTVEPG